MNSHDIRSLYVRFFAERGHRNIPSSSLIPPPEEKTLLFSNAGMNQMKPYFMGLAKPPATRMTSIQKCFRTSDLENVGDNSHCTFFEMLGNFSVGDYFKAEVIPWAWELLTTPQPAGLGLDPTKLWSTVYLDDDEAYDLWRGVGIPPERIVRFDESENYWFMGPKPQRIGPCGPNTEIYYDFGADQGCRQADCAPPTHDCGRYIEIWNLVFMTLYQDEDGSRRPLPQRNVDTGGGFERWPMTIMWQDQIDWQGNPKQWPQPPTIYDSDLFQPILAKVGELAGKSYYEANESDQRAMRVVAEHARAAAFLIGDGLTPSNEGRGYVLRRLIRRATSFGQRLSPGVQFLAETADAVIDHMQADHPNLGNYLSFVVHTLGSEESRFQETIAIGRSQLEEFKKRATDKKVPGSEVFQLWDTHGFPPELTMELLAEDGYSVPDPESFERLMGEQRQRSRAGAHFEADAERIQAYVELSLDATEFLGYETNRAYGTVSAILLDGTTPVRHLTTHQAEGHRIEVVLDRTPFYAEGGGQVGDQGELLWPQGKVVVEDTQAVGDGGVSSHLGRLVAGSLSVGDQVEAVVDESRRGDIMRNHTATHILHAALREIVGTHVRQAGSLVSPDRLRFDFTHLEALTPEQLREVEFLANRVVRENLTVHIDYKPYEEAIAGGALAFFGDKYADTVRVVGVCDLQGNDCFSHELCGGTHVHASGDVGAILITGETSIGAGLRRIEAMTGRAAAEHIRRQEDAIAGLSLMLKAPAMELPARIAGLQDEVERLRKQSLELQRRLARHEAQSVTATAEMNVESTQGVVSFASGTAFKVGDVYGIARKVDEATSVDSLRITGDEIKRAFKSAVILLAAVIDGKPVFLAMVTPDVAKRVSAGDIVKVASAVAGGGGGGRSELAQGGGTDASKIDAALAAGRKLIEERLAAS